MFDFIYKIIYKLMILLFTKAHSSFKINIQVLKCIILYIKFLREKKKERDRKDKIEKNLIERVKIK